jgi:hypothetical protein
MAAPPQQHGGWRQLRARASELWHDFGWREASGSVGDLGTFLPLLVGLTVQCNLDVGTTLVFTVGGRCDGTG